MKKISLFKLTATALYPFQPLVVIPNSCHQVSPSCSCSELTRKEFCWQDPYNWATSTIIINTGRYTIKGWGFGYGVRAVCRGSFGNCIRRARECSERSESQGREVEAQIGRSRSHLKLTRTIDKGHRRTKQETRWSKRERNREHSEDSGRG